MITEQHRQGQLAVRAVALRDFVRLWPLWTGDEASFRRLIAATLPLIRAHRELSAALSAAYYQTFRSAEKVPGTPTPRLAGPIDETEVGGTLFVTGQGMTRDAILSGQAPEAAMQTALTRVSGSVTRQVLEGGRTTLLQSTSADRQAQGWVRVTSGDPCAFCAVIASNGPVYGEDSAAFEAHDHCTCTAEPAYEGSEWPGRAREFRDHYNRAVREARAGGELRRGTSNDLLNAFRRSFSR